MSSDGEHI